MNIITDTGLGSCLIIILGSLLAAYAIKGHRNNG